MTAENNLLIRQLEENIARVVFGKLDVVRMCIVALLAGEHMLLEDVPGVGKTLMGKALARSISGRFCRIQFTPDLLPTDITGGSVYRAGDQEFVFSRGPVFANVVLADEINRTTPRTQSALLEAMSEAQVSVDGQTYALPKPFVVIATQNPLEFEGTYPLPESQLDRFLMRISIGYPDREQELNDSQVIALQEAVREVTVEESVTHYLLDLVDATRDCEELRVGASIRGTLALYRACQAWALVEGRGYVVPDDVKRLAVPVLSHRVITKGYLHGSQRDAVESLIGRLVEEMPVPT
jgi:MoxR-like ATPase